MMNRAMTIQRQLVLGFSIGPVILAIICMIIYADTQGMIAKRALTRHSYDVLLSISMVQVGVVDLETGQRGYLLTGDSTYLQPYEAARAAMDRRLAELGALTQDNPAQQRSLTALRGLVAHKVSELDETIGLRRDKGFDAAIAVVRSGRGKTAMDGIRLALEQMRNEETRLLDQRRTESQQLEQLTLNTVIYGTLVCFVLLAVAAVATVRAITTPVRAAVEALASASTEILAGATQQAAGMRQQTSAVAETVSTVDEVLQTSEQAAQRAAAVADSSQKASEVGAAGRQAVLDTVSMMDGVRDQSRAIAESILTLSERAQAIGDIIAAVNEIAEQTNLLALNASIEASRAGEQGLAFSVVAGEIKALADQSKKSTAQVRQILGEIQKSTNAAVLVTEEGARGVDRAITTANEAGSTISALVDTIMEASLAAAQIVASAGQQATGMGQIHQAMSHVKEASNQSLAATRQSEQAAMNLHTLGQSLRAMVGVTGR
jgi:methyl-accepting chemotaxis protein